MNDEVQARVREAQQKAKKGGMIIVGILLLVMVGVGIRMHGQRDESNALRSYCPTVAPGTTLNDVLDVAQKEGYIPFRKELVDGANPDAGGDLALSLLIQSWPKKTFAVCTLPYRHGIISGPGSFEVGEEKKKD